MRKQWNPVSGLAVALAMAITLTAGSFAAAQTLGDADGDGVADAIDMCPETPKGDMVSPDGCSVCPCDAAWSSHQAYVDCVYYEATRRATLGLLTRKQKSTLITAAKNSTCGTTYIRCCQWRKLISGSMGRCTIMDPAKCSYQILGRWAEIRGTGTCTFNPCTW